MTLGKPFVGCATHSTFARYRVCNLNAYPAYTTIICGVRRTSRHFFPLKLFVRWPLPNYHLSENYHPYKWKNLAFMYIRAFLHDRFGDGNEMFKKSKIKIVKALCDIFIPSFKVPSYRRSPYEESCYETFKKNSMLPNLMDDTRIAHTGCSFILMPTPGAALLQHVIFVPKRSEKRAKQSALDEIWTSIPLIRLQFPGLQSLKTSSEPRHSEFAAVPP